jgi:uncharacterized membrane protein YjjP (DUF1212 family)
VAAGDAVALLLFVVIGLSSHDKGITWSGLFRDALPVLAGWFVAAAIFQLYARGGIRPFVATWVAGITGGILVRGLVLHRHVLGARYITFLAVTLAVTLVLLLAVRGLLALGLRARRGRVSS